MLFDLTTVLLQTNMLANIDVYLKMKEKQQSFCFEIGGLYKCAIAIQTFFFPL